MGLESDFSDVGSPTTPSGLDVLREAKDADKQGGPHNKFEGVFEGNIAKMPKKSKAAPLYHNRTGEQAAADERLDPRLEDDAAPMPLHYLDDLGESSSMNDDKKKKKPVAMTASENRLLQHSSHNHDRNRGDNRPSATMLPSAPLPSVLSLPNQPSLPPPESYFPHEVEATIVVDPLQQPSTPIYDAVLLHNHDFNQALPWWKRRPILLSLGIGLLAGAFVAILAALVASHRSNGANTSPSSNNKAAFSSNSPMASPTTLFTSLPTSNSPTQGDLPCPEGQVLCGVDHNFGWPGYCTSLCCNSDEVTCYDESYNPASCAKIAEGGCSCREGEVKCFTFINDVIGYYCAALCCEFDEQICYDENRNPISCAKYYGGGCPSNIS